MMNNENLKDLWQAATKTDVTVDGEILLQALQRKLDKIRRIHKGLDYGFLATGALVIPAFIFIAVQWPNAGVIAGVTLSIATFLVIAFKTRHVRSGDRQGQAHNISLREYLTTEQRSIERRIRMYKTAWIWFYLPLWIGWSTIMIFVPLSPFMKTLLPAIMFVLCVIEPIIIAWITIRKKLKPALLEIEAMLGYLETERD